MKSESGPAASLRNRNIFLSPAAFKIFDILQMHGGHIYLIPRINDLSIPDYRNVE